MDLKSEDCFDWDKLKTSIDELNLPFPEYSKLESTIVGYLNQFFCYIRNAREKKIGMKVWDFEENRPTVNYLSLSDFEKMMEPKKITYYVKDGIKYKEKTVNLAWFWRMSSSREEVDQVVYNLYPSTHSKHGFGTILNLYIGPTLDIREDVNHDSIVEGWRNYLDQLFNEQDRNYLVYWMAHLIQKPWSRLPHLIMVNQGKTLKVFDFLKIYFKYDVCKQVEDRRLLCFLKGNITLFKKIKNSKLKIILETKQQRNSKYPVLICKEGSIDFPNEIFAPTLIYHLQQLDLNLWNKNSYNGSNVNSQVELKDWWYTMLCRGFHVLAKDCLDRGTIKTTSFHRTGGREGDSLWLEEVPVSDLYKCYLDSVRDQISEKYFLQGLKAYVPLETTKFNTKKNKVMQLQHRVKLTEDSEESKVFKYICIPGWKDCIQYWNEHQSNQILIPEIL